MAWRKGKQVGIRPQPPASVPMDRLFVDNFTLEGMRGVLEHNSRGKVLVAVSELAGVFGNADAQYNLARMYLDGAGTERSPRQASRNSTTGASR